MKFKDRFVGVEGVYSMDGDVAPLDKIVPICKRNNSILIVDDEKNIVDIDGCILPFIKILDFLIRHFYTAHHIRL